MNTTTSSSIHSLQDRFIERLSSHLHYTLPTPIASTPPSTPPAAASDQQMNQETKTSVQRVKQAPCERVQRLRGSANALPSHARGETVCGYQRHGATRALPAGGHCADMLAPPAAGPRRQTGCRGAPSTGSRMAHRRLRPCARTREQSTKHGCSGVPGRGSRLLA